MEIPNSLYTAPTLFSLSGSATAVWIMTSVTGYLMKPKKSRQLKKWLGLILSIALSLIGATQIDVQTPITWVVAIVNGFLIYLTAVGANTIVDQASNYGSDSNPNIRQTGASRGSFIEAWW